MQQPLISVIVPCYNQAQYMDECLQSVLDQTYQNWECIIVNDGSPDNTEEIALQWTKKDSRFIYLKKENGGLSSARNAGIEIAKGEWIQFLDCDDLIKSDKFKKSAVFFSKNDLIISNYQLFSGDKLLADYCSYINENLDYRNIILNWDIKFTIPIHCGLFRKKMISNFNRDLQAKEDWFFWIKYFKNKPKVKLLIDRLVYYRAHNNNMTKDLSHMLINEEKAYQFIYNSLEEDLKFEFFKTRIHFKNELILKNKKDTESNLIQINKQLERLQNSERYKFIDKLLSLIGK